MAEEAKNQKDPTINVRELVEMSIKRLDDIATIRANAREKYVDDKFKSKDDQYQIQFAAAEKAVAAALVGTKEAINKADENNNKRFDLQSEKIDGILDTMNKNSGERGIYVTHSDLSIFGDKLQSNIESMIRPVIAKVDQLSIIQNTTQGRSSGLNAGWLYLIGGLSAISTIISILVAVITFSK